MVTETDKKLAESIRTLGRAAFDVANEIDPPYPCRPFGKPFTCVGAGGWPGFIDENGIEQPSCEASCTAYQVWKFKQEE